MRVLERRKAAEKAGLQFTAEPVDLLDARGYADGVKVARKVSKANVLGKAAEYIRVLKRREARLEKEKDGLRELIQGLVGGQALLREFEAGWAAKYGGKERDELEYEGLEEDDEDEDDEDEDDGGRARKRPRVEKKAAAAPAKPAEQPEKRKRGRPRKEQPAPVAAPVPPPVTVTPQTAPGAQYLLAAFAFFSFFNIPGRAPTHTHHGHTGTVLTSAPGPSHAASQAVFGMEWHDIVGAFHLLVSALVFASIVMPWLPTILKVLRLPSGLSSTLRRPSFTRKLSEPSTGSARQDHFPLALVDALSPTARGAPDEAAQLRAALRIWPGLTGVLVRVVGKISRGRRADRGIERLQLEQRAWMRLGEVIALDGTASFGNRVQAYLGAMSHMPAFSPQPSDLATLALLALPLSAARAESLWEKAAAARVVRPAEVRPSPCS